MAGSCDQCSRVARCLTSGVILLDTYRAISSEPFLWLACTDPLLAAFNLAADLEVCEEMEKEFKVRHDSSEYRLDTYCFSQRSNESLRFK